MPHKDDDSLASDHDAVTGRAHHRYDEELHAGVRSITDTCDQLVQHGDPPPHVKAAISLIRRAAALVDRLEGPEERPCLVERIAIASLALRGFAVPYRDEEGVIIRLRDRWAAIFREIEHAASHLPSGDARRDELAAAAADRVMMIAGCEVPPDRALILAALEAQPAPRPEDDALLQIMSAVGLPSAEADSLARSIRKALPFIASLRDGTD